VSDSYQKHRGYRFGDYVLDFDRGALLRHDNELKLRPKSYEVLRILVENAGKLVSRQELFDTAWSTTVVTDDALTQCLMDIRRALRDAEQDLIKTVPRRGYIFEAVTLPLAKPTGPRKEEPELAKETSTRATPKGLSRYLWWAAAAAVIILLGSAVRLVGTTSGSVEPHAPKLNANLPAIAVIPLLNMSSHTENVYFAGGIHEDVLTNLAQIDGLKVISRTSMLKFTASDMSLQEIGGELGVDYIVEGSVRRIGNHVRVTIQLIDVHNDRHLWANNYERELRDEFATQRELAREIADSIRLELQPDWIGALEDMPTKSVKAYDLYSRAENLEKLEGETEASVLRRRAMLEEAVTEDPGFVEAWAVLKRIYDLQRNRMGPRGWYVANGQDMGVLTEDLKVKAKRALDKAVVIEPNNVETLLSSLVDHDWPKSPKEMQSQKAVFDRLIRMHPQHAKTWYHLGWWYSNLSQMPGQDVRSTHADAIAAFEEALRLDPFNARMVSAVLSWHRQRGYQEDAARFAAQLKQIIPETDDDRSLARWSWAFKKREIISSFLKTADESLVEDYRKGWQEAVDNDRYQVRPTQFLDEAELSILSADKDRLAELSRLSFAISKSEYHYVVHTLLKSTGISMFVDSGNLDDAKFLARRVLEQEDTILLRGMNSCLCTYHDLARAHDMIGPGALAQAQALLGNTEESLRLNKALLDGTNLNPVTRVRILGHIDVERAVDAAFIELAENPGWNGFDVLAAYYVFNRQILAHPRVQAHYRKEDKWLGYLSSRMPEHYRR